MDKASEILLERFRSYLETRWQAAQASAAPDLEADAPPPAAEPPPDAPDLFSLLAELAGLRNEVKLESRQVKGALDQFREVFGTLEAANRQLAAELARQRQEAQTLAAETERALLLELLELRDRIQHAHDQAAGYRPNWIARGSGAADFIDGMAQGIAMNLRRLDESLTRREVSPIPALGQPFDPHVMQAIEVVADPWQPSGQVVRQVRAGYRRGETLLRLAEVIVNRIADDPALETAPSDALPDSRTTDSSAP